MSAVDDRQPIILTTAQFEKVKKKNTEWMNENEKLVLEWGSSKENKKSTFAPDFFVLSV